MNRKKALIAFTLFDILSFFIFWLGIHQIHQIVIDISNSSNSVSFINRAGIPIILLGVPVIHILAIFEHFYPTIVSKRPVVINRGIVAFGVLLLAIAVLISVYTKKYVEKAGYQYCREASGVSALFKTLVYTKDEEICRQLTEERREMLGLPPK